MNSCSPPAELDCSGAVRGGSNAARTPPVAGRRERNLGNSRAQLRITTGTSLLEGEPAKLR